MATPTTPPTNPGTPCPVCNGNKTVAVKVVDPATHKATGETREAKCYACRGTGVKGLVTK